MKIDIHGGVFVRKTDSEDLYYLHHLHHFKKKKGAVHELHHCPLFEKPGMKGKQYSIIHKINKDQLFHCLKQKFTGTLYDHQGNKYVIQEKRLGKRSVFVIKI